VKYPNFIAISLQTTPAEQPIWGTMNFGLPYVKGVGKETKQKAVLF
jgi:hypothetical protein